MSRLPLPSPETATGEVKQAFDHVQAAYRMVPNGIRALGSAPSVLSGYLAFGEALGEGALSHGERERIAVLTAQRNACGYCLSAHTAAGRAAGLSHDDLLATRLGQVTEPRAAAVVRLAGAVLEHKGDVPDHEIAAARAAGLSDGELVEIVAHVSMNTFTNYLNRLVQPEYDFPAVSLDAAETASERAAS